MNGPLDVLAAALDCGNLIWFKDKDEYRTYTDSFEIVIRKEDPEYIIILSERIGIGSTARWGPDSFQTNTDEQREFLDKLVQKIEKKASGHNYLKAAVEILSVRGENLKEY